MCKILCALNLIFLMNAFELRERERNILSCSFYSSTAFIGNQFRMQFKAAAAITGSSPRIQADFIVYTIVYTYTKQNSLHCTMYSLYLAHFLMQPQARARTRNRIYWSSQWSQQKELDSSRNRTAVIIPITIINVIIIIIVSYERATTD